MSESDTLFQSSLGQSKPRVSNPEFKNMKKNNKLHIPIDTEQKEILKKRAESLGLSLTGYCTLILLKTIPKIEEIPD